MIHDNPLQDVEGMNERYDDQEAHQMEEEANIDWEQEREDARERRIAADMAAVVDLELYPQDQQRVSFDFERAGGTNLQPTIEHMHAGWSPGRHETESNHRRRRRDYDMGRPRTLRRKVWIDFGSHRRLLMGLVTLGNYANPDAANILTNTLILYTTYKLFHLEMS